MPAATPTTPTCASTSGPSGTAARARDRAPVRGPRRAHEHRDRPAGRAEHHGIASTLFVPIELGRRGPQRRARRLDDAARDHAPTTIELAELAADQAAAGLARLEAEERRAARLGPGPRRRPRRPRAQRHASTCRRSCSRSSTRPRWRSTPRCPASTSATASRARSRPPATASPRAGTACTSRPARAPRARCSQTGEPFISNDYQQRRRAPDHPSDGASSSPRSRSRWSGTTSCAACSRSAGRRAAASTTRTCRRSRRSPASPRSPAATPRPTSTSSTSPAPTR